MNNAMWPGVVFEILSKVFWHLEHPFMGARMLRDQLNRVGLDVGRKACWHLMKRMSKVTTQFSTVFASKAKQSPGK
jgi:hypothetical protein